MMKVYKNPNPNSWPTILTRPAFDNADLEQRVRKILEDVKNEGDQAILKYTNQFDQVALDHLKVSNEEVKAAEGMLPNDLKEAIRIAHQNISSFHQRQKVDSDPVETMPGVVCWRKDVAIDKVGLYIPGGTAPLFSTVLMLGVPAKIAGCREIVLCSPPQKDGLIHPAILFAAKLAGINKIFKVGGVQAVGAMAYGSESIPNVYKIFGPGNQYVTKAKQLVSLDGIAIDMPAGPSEVLVVADQTAVPSFVAADLLSQAEHGVDSQVVLVTFSESQVEAVNKAMQDQLEKLPRKEIATEALKNSVAIVLNDKNAAGELINYYGPEHLIIAMDEAVDFSNQIRNAGSIFLGHYTPESVGDYASGTNHTLPTNGFAKAYSGVSYDSFVKKITYQQLSYSGLQLLGPTVEKMAQAEALEAHKNAVTIRLDHGQI